ncbi:TldD/PmbA family protein [Candidatus Cyanaurora vandensis]|uniref:TldD/PmbA family protein n=1 Tax=Candidatus Cyanaurora vandensis TaxID=2714958 RepID=UPI00257D0724|nr:TldD/PmbA family protein [Candidatus Cyanaurora vandensis]
MDPNQLQDLVRRYQSQVDFLLIRWEEAQGTDIVLSRELQETCSEISAQGGQVRACYRGGWGFASCNRVDQLTQCVEQAIRGARLVGQETTILAPVTPQIAHYGLDRGCTDPRQIPLEEKLALCQTYNHLLLKHHPRITSTSVRYGDSWQQVTLVTSEGSVLSQAWVDLEMRFAALATSGNQVQTGRETLGSRRGFADLLGYEAQVQAAAGRAVQALDLPGVQGGVYTVVIDPILSGLFVHEAFGHLSEADTVYENPDLLETMSLGRRFGPKGLHILDGAAPPGHRGSYHFDDEGTPARLTPLIRDGELVGRLHSRETAGHLEEAPTGNARCLDYHYPSLVRMTNTWIAPSHTDPLTPPVNTSLPVQPENIRAYYASSGALAGIERGLLCVNWLGGMTNGEMFTFAAGQSWLIEQGELTQAVRDVNLSGNVFETLADIEWIGSDFFWDESGGCGKGGQSGLAVGCGGPSLRIRDLLVGGQ